MTDELDIARIVIGERDRTELGDLADLVASISAVGLLHPVVITKDHELVAGERRLAAAARLGWQKVPVTVVDLTNAADVLRAEADENTCRKPLTPYEASRARERRARVLAPKAREAQGTRTDLQPSANLAEGSTSRETRKVAAIGTGYSGSTLDKVDRIRDAAERGVVRQGRSEVPAPPEVQQVARAVLEDVKVTGAAVEKAHSRLVESVDRFIAGDQDIKDAKFRANVWKQIKATGDGLLLLDVNRTAEVADEDVWDALARLRGRLEAWLDAVEAKRPRGLRVVGKE